MFAIDNRPGWASFDVGTGGLPVHQRSRMSVRTGNIVIRVE